jgi:Astacin (Peptidase family M12A)
VANNGFGQVAVVFSSSSYPGTTGNSVTGMPGACLDDQRDTMRLLMNLLSVRSEHNRNDRNTYLTLQSSNPNSLVVSPLDKYNLFAIYNSSVTIASTFDYQSITLVSGEKFAASLNTPVFVPVGSNTVGALARLSRTDCLVINMLYRCNAPCPDRK